MREKRQNRGARVVFAPSIFLSKRVKIQLEFDVFSLFISVMHPLISATHPGPDANDIDYSEEAVVNRTRSGGTIALSS